MIRELTIGKYTFALRTILLVAALVALVIACVAIPSCLQKRRSAAAQAKVERSQAEAAKSSAKDASEAQAQINRNEVESEALGRSNERTIRDAQGSNAVVAAPARDAGIAALCLRRAYRDTERCRMLRTR